MKSLESRSTGEREMNLSLFKDAYMSSKSEEDNTIEDIKTSIGREIRILEMINEEDRTIDEKGVDYEKSRGVESKRGLVLKSLRERSGCLEKSRSRYNDSLVEDISHLQKIVSFKETASTSTHVDPISGCSIENQLYVQLNSTIHINESGREKVGSTLTSQSSIEGSIIDRTMSCSKSIDLYPVTSLNDIDDTSIENRHNDKVVSSFRGSSEGSLGESNMMNNNNDNSNKNYSTQGNVNHINMKTRSPEERSLLAPDTYFNYHDSPSSKSMVNGVDSSFKKSPNASISEMRTPKKIVREKDLELRLVQKESPPMSVSPPKYQITVTEQNASRKPSLRDRRKFSLINLETDKSKIGKVNPKTLRLDYAFNRTTRPPTWQLNCLSTVLSILSQSPPLKMAPLLMNISSPYALALLKEHSQQLLLSPSPRSMVLSPHLYFTQDTIRRGDTRFKFGQPIRDAYNRNMLMDMISRNYIDTLSSGHIYVPPSMKDIDGGCYLKSLNGRPV